MSNEINKDFYNLLPSMVCMQLDDIWIPKFSARDWFPKAWEEYRQHVKETSMDEVRMPMHVFKNYLTEEELKTS